MGTNEVGPKKQTLFLRLVWYGLGIPGFVCVTIGTNFVSSREFGTIGAVAGVIGAGLFIICMILTSLYNKRRYGTTRPGRRVLEDQ